MLESVSGYIACSHMLTVLSVSGSVGVGEMVSSLVKNFLKLFSVKTLPSLPCVLCSINTKKSLLLEADPGQEQSHSQASDRSRKQTADKSVTTKCRQMEGTGRKVENSNLGSLFIKLIQENMLHSLTQHILEAQGLSFMC